MSIVQSNMMKLGTKAPAFHLLDTISKERLSFSDLRSDISTVVVFICNHCPFVHHINQRLVEIANEYQEKGVRFIAICSNDVDYYPQDGPEMMSRVAENMDYPFPYLYDETQEVARAYQAECTPDFFVFDGNSELAYRGRFDESRPNMGAASGRELSTALNALLEGEVVSENQYPSIGCSIKWK